jgi:hypothetical protein
MAWEIPILPQVVAVLPATEVETVLKDLPRMM